MTCYLFIMQSRTHSREPVLLCEATDARRVEARFISVHSTFKPILRLLGRSTYLRSRSLFRCCSHVYALGYRLTRTSIDVRHPAACRRDRAYGVARNATMRR